MAFKMKGFPYSGKSPMKQTKKEDTKAVHAAFDAYVASKALGDKEETKRLYNIYVKLRDAAGKKHGQKPQ